MAEDKKIDIDLGISRLESGDAERLQCAVLTINTGKHYNGGIASGASVYWHGKHSRQRMIGIGGSDGDFSKGLLYARDVKATQRAIDKQHAEVFTADVIRELTEAAIKHYAPVVSAGVDGFKNKYIQPQERAK